MHLEVGSLYHVYNRGNNKQPIFFNADNYVYFKKNIQRFLVPHCDILAWCLMPNHFHFLVHANERSVIQIKDGSFARQQFSQGVKQLLSSYTKAINKQQDRTGSLFQQKTKSSCIENDEKYPAETVFHYIHQNPLRAGLVKKMEDWPHSSFQGYLAIRDDGICNQNLALHLLKINSNRFYEDSYDSINYTYVNE